MTSLETNENIIAGFNPFEGDPIQRVVPSTESQKEVFASCILGEKDANLAYNLSMSLHFEGAVQPEVLKECTTELISRHESLRASFSEDGEQMIIYETQPVRFFFQDLSSYPPSGHLQTVDAYLWQDAAMEFDIIKGPLIRFAFFKLGPETSIFTITVHHLICDGW